VITLRNVTKSFGSQTLFENVALQINDGDRYALVGPNGAGKSTLFRLIMGQEPPDEGDIFLRKGISFGYLPQETAALSGKAVLEEVLEGDSSDSRREAQAKKTLMGLGFRITDFARPTSELSGGWKMRVMIARLLMQAPDLLMLDEPTNHLDLESLLWFQDYLQNYRGAIFLISHDREFINSVVTRIVEVRDHDLKMYTGSFEDYLEQRKREDENLISAYKRQQKEIQELEDYINRFRAKASTASSVQSKIKYLERMEKIEPPASLKTVGFSFPQPARSGQNVLILKDVCQSYDGVQWVYEKLNLTLERGQRAAFVGPNGAGKSTLLKLLGDKIPFQAGERKLGYNVDVAYFSQHRVEMFRSGRTVLEEASDTRRQHSVQTIRTVLGSFLFQGESVFKKVDVLSGGEKSRLGLARLLLDPANLLLLDEPTTHLDMASVEMLIEALKAFKGTLCFISHDVYFMRQLANQVIHINRGEVTTYPGDYDYFLHRKSREKGEEAELFRSEERIETTHHRSHSPAPQVAVVRHPGKKTKEQKRREAEERQARYRDAREQTQKNQQSLELKKEEAALLDQLADPATHQYPLKVIELSRRLAQIQKQISSS